MLFLSVHLVCDIFLYSPQILYDVQSCYGCREYVSDKTCFPKRSVVNVCLVNVYVNEMSLGYCIGAFTSVICSLRNDAAKQKFFCLSDAVSRNCFTSDVYRITCESLDVCCQLSASTISRIHIHWSYLSYSHPVYHVAFPHRDTGRKRSRL